MAGELPTELKSWTLAELSNELDVGVLTLRRYIGQGRLRAVKVGKSYRVTANALKEFLEGNVRPRRRRA